MLFLLPKYIQLAICVNYLTVCDICYLDTANSNKQKRAACLAAWKDSQMAVTGLPEVVLGSSFLNWLFTRGICVFQLNIQLDLVGTLHFSSCSFKFLQMLELREPVESLVHQSNLNKRYSDLVSKLCNECHCLRTLILSEPRFKKLAPLVLNNCETLTAVNCCGIEDLSDTDIYSTLQCPQLTHLNLHNCRFSSGKYLVHRMAFKSIQLLTLNVQNCKGFDDALLLSVLPEAPRLTALNIAFTSVTASAAFSTVRDCLQLTEFCYSSMTAEGMKRLLATCSLLRSLIIHWDDKQPFSESALIECATSLSALTTFKLIGAPHFSLHETNLSLTSVTELSLAGCTRICAQFLMRIVECRQLTSLDISGCEQLIYRMILESWCTDRMRYMNISQCILITIVPITYCHNLTHLDMNSVNATDSDLQQVIDGCCKSLRVLHLKSCSKLTSASYVYIAQHCDVLRELSMDGSGVTDAVLEEFAFACSELRLLDIKSRAVTVSNAAIKMFMSMRKKVKLVY